ncbi:nucleotidyl transferase AbiEii/AbiGii toxin family protein [Anabaena azotica]|uniref:Nucleotidyl transferase AbiEii/AbiGii toxin family protein n=1 Tax=Anabaena azotica FACHB-119 TaxID=947527 RepID=A0ABR8D056_9NOST|nr:nucleotidyl transferase AbiEii/AbiGii toxin family protein [Anabaena azotica]MBD2500565.1 nucleotidyl transferase AbiEii/AbiGii toxin family protein [Anabaena azotica FACHB-119]
MLTSNEKQVLTELLSIISQLNLPMILVGAGARLLMFDQKFAVQGRRTKDWDVAVSINNWETYQQLSEYLTQGDSPRFKSTKNSHKFKHIETNIEVDIVPFGEIGEPDQEIVWPDSENPMNVLGFAEALSSAKTVDIENLEIPVIDTPAFIVLKVFAWGDRGERTNKDLDDIEFILRKYEDEERVYDELAEELADGVVEFLDANIYLLGQDIYNILQEKTLIELNKLLDNLIENLDIDQPETLGYMLNVLRKGVSSLSSQS